MPVDPVRDAALDVILGERYGLRNGNFVKLQGSRKRYSLPVAETGEWSHPAAIGGSRRSEKQFETFFRIVGIWNQETNEVRATEEELWYPTDGPLFCRKGSELRLLNPRRVLGESYAEQAGSTAE